MRLPKHIGIIPDGNRRWAVNNGLSKEKGYDSGINPGLELYKQCKEYGIKEITYYGFTVDNTKRPTIQKEAFIKACVDSVNLLIQEDCELLVMGNTNSPSFPKKLLPYTTRRVFGKGGIKVNLLINYGWKWDLKALLNTDKSSKIITSLHSKDISRIDLIIRLGGRRRLSGFLPVQSVYSDFYVIDDLWPDFNKNHLKEALAWYNIQDVTLGG